MTEHGNFKPDRNIGNEEAVFLKAKLGVMGVIIEELRRRSGTQPRSLLDRLGVSQEVINDPENTEHQKLAKALRRTAGLIHPDVHSQEDPLIQKALTFAVTPVTEALNILRKSKNVSE